MERTPSKGPLDRTPTGSGYGGHVPGVRSENLHGGNTSEMARLASLSRELEAQHRLYFEALTDQHLGSERTMSKVAMVKAFELAKIEHTPEELDQIWKNADADSNGSIDFDEYLACVKSASGLGELMRKTGPNWRPDRFKDAATPGFSGHVSPDAIKVGESQYTGGGSVMHKMVSMYAVKGTASSGGYVSPFDPKGQTRLKLQRDLRDLAETCDKPPGYTGHVRGGKYSLSKQTPASGPESFSPTGRERLSLPLGEKDAGGVQFVTTYGNSYGARES